MADSDRVAELKKKMQESAAKRAREAEEAAASAPATPVTPAAPATPATPSGTTETVVNAATETRATQAQEVSAEAVAVETTEKETVATSEVAAPAAITPVAARTVSPPPAVIAPSTNGASGAAQAIASDGLSAEELAKRDMSRRELLTYAWGGALALVTGASGVGLFKFMYPRFRAGEFGGEFFLPVADVPAPDAAPVAEPGGKFWLVEAEGGDLKAIYMVCTHLGCLYKWEPSTFRFECPCHGSKFSKDGFYIEGPAPRSLDTFATRVEGDILVVDTGAKTLGSPSAESPVRAAAGA